MILAAGRGARLKPLTNTTPKPLIKAGGKALLDYHLEKLSATGFTDIVINTSWLAEQIEVHIRQHSGSTIVISHEPEALETAGGIHKALPLLGDGYFLLVSADIWSEFNYKELKQTPMQNNDAHLFMVKNPAHNRNGDFSLQDNKVIPPKQASFTYSGIGIFHTRLFKDITANTKVPLRDILAQTIKRQSITGSVVEQTWFDIGTTERLDQLQQYIQLQQT